MTITFEQLLAANPLHVWLVIFLALMVRRFPLWYFGLISIYSKSKQRRKQAFEVLRLIAGKPRECCQPPNSDLSDDP
jgi:hypothetical protein